MLVVNHMIWKNIFLKRNNKITLKHLNAKRNVFSWTSFIKCNSLPTQRKSVFKNKLLNNPLHFIKHPAWFKILNLKLKVSKFKFWLARSNNVLAPSNHVNVRRISRKMPKQTVLSCFTFIWYKIVNGLIRSGYMEKAWHKKDLKFTLNSVNSKFFPELHR